MSTCGADNIDHTVFIHLFGPTDLVHEYRVWSMFRKVLTNLFWSKYLCLFIVAVETQHNGRRCLSFFFVFFFFGGGGGCASLFRRLLDHRHGFQGGYLVD